MDKQVQVTRRTKDCEYNRWLILDDPFFYMFFVGLNAWKSTGGKIQSTAFITQSSELLCFIFEACDNWVVMHYQNRKKSDKLSMWMENLTWEGQMMVGGCWVFSRLYYMYFNPFCSNFGSNFNKKKVLISFGVLPHVLNTHTGSHLCRESREWFDKMRFRDFPSTRSISDIWRYCWWFRNPAPPGIYKGKPFNWLAGFLNHQQ